MNLSATLYMVKLINVDDTTVCVYSLLCDINVDDTTHYSNCMMLVAGWQWRWGQGAARRGPEAAG